MKFSIITPEHSKENLPYLQELYESLQSQTYENWEWVLYLNNGYKQEWLPASIQANPKVVIF